MVEQKFKQFRQSVKAEEFNSIEFLVAKAEQLEASDPELSKRILVRVENLKRQRNTSGNSIKSEAHAGAQPQKKQTLASTSVSNGPDNSSTSTIIQILKRSPFAICVLLPTFIFAFYQCFWASERFESQAQVTVRQPDAMATMDASMAILSGLGVSNSSTVDTELIKAFINSTDMLDYLQQELDLRRHYSQSNVDFFSRLESDASHEELLEYYQDHITVEISDKSGVLTVKSQAFDSNYAFGLTQKIVEHAEWYINSIGHQLAESQLAFIKQEHQVVEQKLEQAQSRLMNFQQKYNLLDPTAEGTAMQQITYTLEGQISAKEAQLKGLRAMMSDNTPQVRSLQTELESLKQQVISERNKLVSDSGSSIPVNEILSRFTDLKVKMELALTAYTSSQVSLEKSRVEAYRQLKYLITVESATEPQESRYPESFYNIVLFAILTSMIYAIGKIIITTIRELK